MLKQSVIFQDLGQMDYKSAWDYQENLLQENVRIKSKAYALEAGSVPERADLPEITRHHLLFVEHPPVYTLGKSGQKENILISEETLNGKGIGFFHTNRGGDITYHGPGQIVGYPILDLEKFYTDIGKYLRNIEEVMIRTLSEYGITGDRSPGETGVWIDPDIKGRERKICAIGVRSSRWITMHVTSLEKELGYELDMDEVKEKVKKNFEKVFDVQLIINR